MAKQKFTIEEAVEYTGIKRRTFERINVSFSKESRKAKDGKEREIRIYDRAELDRVKESKQQKKFVPALSMPTDDKPAAQVITPELLEGFANFIVNSVLDNNRKQLQAYVEENESKNAKEKKQSDISTFKDKQILNLSQAVAYSGLPAEQLKNGLKSKKIAGKKTSKNGVWKIYRISLDEFCKNYFD